MLRQSCPAGHAGTPAMNCQLLFHATSSKTVAPSGPHSAALLRDLCFHLSSSDPTSNFARLGGTA
jgi:hypothetical protein